MAFSYNPAQPTALDRVRFLVGDTVAAVPRLQDEEIAGILSRQPSEYYAAYLAARALVARYAGLVTTSGDGLSKQYDQLTRHYGDLAKDLKVDAIRFGGVAPIPYAGGLSWLDKHDAASDSDRVRPAFTRQMDRPPGAGSDSPAGDTFPGDAP